MMILPAHSGEEKALDTGKHSLPSNIILRAAFVFKMRPSPDIHALSNMMEMDKMDIKWGNLYGYKLSLESVFTGSLTTIITRALGIKAAAYLAYKILSSTTITFSNIVGPKEEVSFCGHTMTYLAASAYGVPNAIIVHFQSYMNKVKIVLTVDENLALDPHQLCMDLADSLRLMKDAIVAMQ
ncbi:hypothetical protein AAC387_Pa12g1874 [Persea americana]